MIRIVNLFYGCLYTGNMFVTATGLCALTFIFNLLLCIYYYVLNS